MFITTTTAELSFYFFRTEEGISLNDNSEFNQTDVTKLNAKDCFVNIGLYSLYRGQTNSAILCCVLESYSVRVDKVPILNQGYSHL